MKKLLLCSLSLLISMNVNSKEDLIDKKRYEVINKPSDIDIIYKKISQIKNIDEGTIDIKPLGNSGMYYIEQEGSKYYISKDGNFIIKGLALEIDKGKFNIYNKKKYHNEISIINDNDGILYNSKNYNKNKDIIVFVDYSCPFCRKFHAKTLPDLIKNGYKVQYLPVLKNPNNGLVERNMENIFCQEDKEYRKKLLENMFSDRDFSIDEKNNKSCNLNYYYYLANSLEMLGTPAIYTRSGKYLGGYQDLESIKGKL